MCIMKQSDQILSRRLSCSLVLLIEQQQSVPFYFALHHFVTRRLSLTAALFIQTSRAARKESFFFSVPSVLLTDGCNFSSVKQSLKKNKRKKENVAFFLMLWFLSW